MYVHDKDAKYDLFMDSLLIGAQDYEDRAEEWALFEQEFKQNYKEAKSVQEVRKHPKERRARYFDDYASNVYERTSLCNICQTNNHPETAMCPCFTCRDCFGLGHWKCGDSL